MADSRNSTLSNESTSTFEQLIPLPYDMVREIASHLMPEDIARLSALNRQSQLILNNDDTWKQALETCFSDDYERWLVEKKYTQETAYQRYQAIRKDNRLYDKKPKKLLSIFTGTNLELCFDETDIKKKLDNVNFEFTDLFFPIGELHYRLYTRLLKCKSQNLQEALDYIYKKMIIPFYTSRGTNSLNIDKRDTNQNTILHHAIMLHQPIADINTLLSTQGIDINAQNILGEPPLFTAAAAGHIEALQLLLNRPDSLIALLNRYGHTLLNLAVISDQPQIVDYLLGMDPVIRVENTNLLSIELAAIHGCSNILIKLLKKFASSDEGKTFNPNFCFPGGNQFSPLHIAAIYNQCQIIKTLLDYGADPVQQDANGNTSFVAAAQNNWLAATIQLCEFIKNSSNAANIDINKAIEFAVTHSSGDAIRALIQHFPECVNTVNNKGISPLGAAIKNYSYSYGDEYLKNIELLLRKGANVQKFKENSSITPLHVAAHKVLPKVVELLLKYNADPNARTKAGTNDHNTPLHRLAASPRTPYITHKTLQVIQILLKYQARIDIPNNNKKTFLDIIKNQKPDWLDNKIGQFLKTFMRYHHLHQLIIEQDINGLKAANFQVYECGLSNPLYSTQESKLMMATKQKPLVLNYIFQKVLPHYTTPNGQIDLARTAFGNLHIFDWAICCFSQINIIKQIISNGTNINRPVDSQGRTLLHLITTIAGYRANFTSIAIILLENGANPNCTDLSGNMPLDRAVYDNNLPMAQILLKKGASAAIWRDHYYCRPVQFQHPISQEMHGLLRRHHEAEDFAHLQRLPLLSQFFGKEAAEYSPTIFQAVSGKRSLDMAAPQQAAGNPAKKRKMDY